MTHYIGSHISIHQYIKDINPYISATKEIQNYGGNLVEFMLDINNKKLNNEIILLEYKKYVKKHNIKIIIHSSYIHNIAQEWNEYSPQTKHMENEIIMAHKINASCIIVHFGKKKKNTTKIGYNNMYTFLIYIHKKTLKYKDVKIVLETTAGQGTEMCHKIEDLAYFYNKFKRLEKHNIEIIHRIKLCIDTCHIFAAGYDMRNKNSIDQYIKTFDELIGIHNIFVVHLNDSKNILGSNVDRHEKIGFGYIGK